MKNDLLATISYFLRYSYAPTFEEIYTFFPKKVAKQAILRQLASLVRNNKILSSTKDYNSNLTRYTMEGYSRALRVSKSKAHISIQKVKMIRHYLRILSYIPYIQMVGLSGTVAMMNAHHGDDIDLFVITSPHSLWTGRIVSLVSADILGIRRSFGDEEVADKICLNLFFDGSSLQVPKTKQTELVAREILQMKPVMVKNKLYERFLSKNRWIYRYFPNARSVYSTKMIMFTKRERIARVYSFIEGLFKVVQLFFISRHRTNEHISSTQLWFHPHK